jgi:RNA polymerase sigma-70 factor (ECF subfamily)
VTDPLVTRARSGDPRAERALYDAHVDRVYRLARGMTRDTEAARDATQRTFVLAFQRLGQFRGDAAFATWLHAIATSVVLETVRKERRREALDPEVEAAPVARPSAPAGPGDPFLRRRLRLEIDALDPEDRALLLLFDLEGYTHEEIAALLGITPGASRVRLHRVRARLRERLAPLIQEGER